MRIFFIRHGERPPKGDNLPCTGLNRALALPAVLIIPMKFLNFTIWQENTTPLDNCN